ncbi:MAG: quaternary amine ABC transporter ATP-binding protein [Caldilineaceae bacterium]
MPNSSGSSTIPTPGTGGTLAPDAPASTARIDVRGLWKVFGATPEKVIDALEQGASKDQVLEGTGHVLAVRNVSFRVQAGETFVVMGLSGSGKSTLLRCLPRLIEATRGQVLIGGQDVGAMKPEELRDLRRHRMSMVFQHFGLLPHRRIIDNVAYGLEIQGIKRAARYEKAMAVLDLVNLKGWENHYPSQLSGGMQQRVGLARALAVDPEILLFDEPFSALDPLIRREMQDELISLQARVQKTLVFITHDFAEAIKLGTHIAIMKDGAFVQVGTAEDLILRPADGYVSAFTRDVPKLRVLSARAIMEPLNGTTHPPAGGSLPASTRLDVCVQRVLESETPVEVTDESGAAIGLLSRRAVLEALRADALAQGAG